MAQFLGNLTIVSGNNSFSTPYTGLQGFLLSNSSGYNLTITMDGTAYTKTLYPNTVDFFPMSIGYTGTIKIVANALLSNVSSFTGNFLQVDAVGLQESINLGSFPLQLAPPSVSSSGTGKPNYSAAVQFSTTATAMQVLNVYNPKNSGMNYEFFTARLYTNDASVPFAQLSYFTGNESVLVNPFSVTSHTIGAVPSTAHASYQDNGSSPTIGGTFELMFVAANTLQDFLAFPDKLEVPPGNNTILLIQSNLTGKKVTLVLKWNENPL